MTLFQRESLRRLHATAIEKEHHISLGLSTSLGGVSTEPYTSLNAGLHVGDVTEAVIENRRRILNEINKELTEAVFAEQVHDNKVAIVTKIDAGRGALSLHDHIHGVDGLVTKEAGLVLAQFYADCVPLYFFDTDNQIIGIAHAGWKGTAKKIAKTMIETFISLGSKPDHIHVVIGPAIEKKAYQVNKDVVERMPIILNEPIMTEVSTNQYLLDLKAVNYHYLLSLGLKETQVDVSSIGTYNHPDLYSYRRDQQTGRMMGYIVQ